jgi:hypothetical protein
MSHGDPTSYLQAPTGVDVISSDGERVGTLAHVLADAEEDIFDGIVIDAGGHRFVDAPQVGEFFTGAVTLKIPAADVASLPEPTENPAVMDSGEDLDSPLQAKLRRAWDMVRGDY